MSPEEIQTFDAQGFLTIPALIEPEEVAALREIVVRLFDERAGRREGAHLDMVGHDEHDDDLLQPSIINPVHFAPELRHSTYRARALTVAQQLLGPEATWSFEHAILKPANSSSVTPWHQDEAYRYDPNFVYEQVSFWLPLQPATLDNGCMRYLPGSHRDDVRPHRSPHDDGRVHVLECVDAVDADAAVDCPVDVGGAVVHHGRVLHGAGPNTTAEDRFAYILGFELLPKPRSEARAFPWHATRRTAAMERQRRWRRRGGVLVEMGRKARFSLLHDPKRIDFEVRRALRALPGVDAFRRRSDGG